jgi:hypothetical protein
MIGALRHHISLRRRQSYTVARAPRGESDI